MKRPYVYALVDPRDGEPFYIGKGQGRRMYAHELDVRRGRGVNAAKCARIAEIIEAGRSVDYRVLSEHDTEEQAYEAECAAISAHSNLTNANRGGGGSYSGEHAEGYERPETTLRKVEDLIARTMPYMDWINARPRTNEEDCSYHMVVKELQTIKTMCLAKINPHVAEATCLR